MKTYNFRVVLASGTDLTDDLAERLGEVGCDDATPWSSKGVVSLGFDREADSLETAIRSAIADIQKAGCTVEHVEIEAETLVGG